MKPGLPVGLAKGRLDLATASELPVATETRVSRFVRHLCGAGRDAEDAEKEGASTLAVRFGEDVPPLETMLLVEARRARWAEATPLPPPSEETDAVAISKPGAAEVEEADAALAPPA